MKQRDLTSLILCEKFNTFFNTESENNVKYNNILKDKFNKDFYETVLRILSLVWSKFKLH